jgi:hypothetical protein
MMKYRRMTPVKSGRDLLMVRALLLELRRRALAR